MRTTRGIIGAVAVVAALGAAGCGGDDGGAGTTASDPDEARLAWAECMREHGVDVPDPAPGGGPTRIQSTGSPAAMDEAQEACSELQRAAMPELSDEERTELLDQAVAFAQCMREHGVDMPDPQFSEDGAMTVAVGGGRLGEEGSGLAPIDEDKFQEASEACGGPGGMMASVNNESGDDGDAPEVMVGNGTDVGDSDGGE